MAGKLFIGWDISKVTQSPLVSQGGSISPASEWTIRWIRPVGVYHNKGAATKNGAFYPPYSPLGYNSGSPYAFLSGGRAYGASYGTISLGTYTAATGETRNTWAGAQGHQLGFARDELFINDEIYMTWDLNFNNIAPSSYPSTYEPINSWAKMFVWGDVEVTCKQTNYLSSAHTVTFSIRNNGVEVATTVVDGVATNVWLFASLRVKLNDTQGAIEFSCNGFTQSTPLAAINTVTTTPLASASIIYLSPPVLDNGTIAHVGSIDNVYIDDSEYPEGRPTTVAISLGTTVSAIDFAQAGGLSLTDALTSYNDTKKIYATSATDGASAVFAITTSSLTTYLTKLIGIDIVCKLATNRNPRQARRLCVSILTEGGEYEAPHGRLQYLNFGSTLPTIPEDMVVGKYLSHQIFQKVDNTQITKTDMSTLNIAIKSVAP